MAATMMRGVVEPVAVLLADGRPVYRAALASLLAAQPLVSVVAEASDAAASISALHASAPRVVVAEPHLQGGVVNLIAWVRENHAAVEVLLYDIPLDDAIVVDALRAGARGFVDCDADAVYLISAIHSVAAGEVVISPRLAHHVTDAYLSLAAMTTSHRFDDRSSLSAREREVLSLAVKGLSNRALAQQLALSEHTVRAHLRVISRKLGARNRVQLVLEATRLGVLNPSKTV
jgi:DNA-binding NarL/FixJ family response regulator